MKRFFTVSSLALAAFLANCATVPDNAPAELKNANQAIKEAKKADADETAPKHINMAKNNLDRGVKEFKDSDGVQARIDSAKAYGNRAKELADQAVDMHNNVKAWDENGEEYKKFKSAGERVGQLENELATVTRERDELNSRTVASTGNPATTVSANGDVVTGAAWFETNSSHPALMGDQNLQRIVSAMEEDKDLTVSVVGFADHRGSGNYNLKLSKKRAEAVAQKLMAAGVPHDRIQVVGKGSEEAVPRGNAIDLQRDRRVDLELTKTAH